MIDVQGKSGREIKRKSGKDVWVAFSRLGLAWVFSRQCGTACQACPVRCRSGESTVHKVIPTAKRASRQSLLDDEFLPPDTDDDASALECSAC